MWIVDVGRQKQIVTQFNLEMSDIVIAGVI